VSQEISDGPNPCEKIRAASCPEISGALNPCEELRAACLAISGGSNPCEDLPAVILEISGGLNPFEAHLAACLEISVGRNPFEERLAAWLEISVGRNPSGAHHAMSSKICGVPNPLATLQLSHAGPAEVQPALAAEAQEAAVVEAILAQVAEVPWLLPPCQSRAPSPSQGQTACNAPSSPPRRSTFSCRWADRLESSLHQRPLLEDLSCAVCASGFAGGALETQAQVGPHPAAASQRCRACRPPPRSVHPRPSQVGPASRLGASSER